MTAKFRVLVTTIVTSNTRQFDGHSAITQTLVGFETPVEAREFIERVNGGHVRVRSPLGANASMSAMPVDPLPEDTPPAAGPEF